MPRFFFHVFNDDVTLDDEGLVLIDKDAAEACAIKSARDLACSSVRVGKLDLDHRIEVNDEDGNRILTITFGDAIKVEGKG
jgi:hypothetical protein